MPEERVLSIHSTIDAILVVDHHQELSYAGLLRCISICIAIAKFHQWKDATVCKDDTAIFNKCINNIYAVAFSADNARVEQLLR